MGYSLKRLLEMKKEKEERAKERERRRLERKKQKEKEAKARKSARRKKASMKRAHRKAELKRQRLAKKYHDSIGDVYGSYVVMITKNRQRFGQIGIRRWKSLAYQLYYETIALNEEDVKMPLRFTVNNFDQGSRLNNRREQCYEILLLRRKTEDDVNSVYRIKNDDGRYVDAIVKGNKNFVIMERHAWRVRESFHVYGYHPVRDRKDYEFIYDKFIKEYDCYKKTERCVLVYNNKLIVKYNEDFDFVICKNKDEAVEMYNVMMKDVDREKLKYVYFMGQVRSRSIATLWCDRIQEKTGWDRYTVKKGYTL